jgi:hypothetical protein
MKLKIFIFFVIFSQYKLIDFSFGCTTAVISGKFTTDGRPLLLKHRDTWALNNKIHTFNDGKYSYTGLVNSGDLKNSSIWIGFNDQGFAIMNSASYNLNNDTIKQTGEEGKLMKLALQTCRTLADFEQLLMNLEKPTRLEANFGVIDGEGGAAFYELGNFNFTKFDANDRKVAPYGYIIRTNHSLTGKLGKGGGYIRFTTAEKVFTDAIRFSDFNAKSILQNLSRNLTNPLIKTDLNDYRNIEQKTPTFVPFLDYIPRSGTSSSVIVEGVDNGEDPTFMTMWSVVGWPLSSVVIPIWLDKNMDLPEMVKYDTTIEDSPICNLSLQLKKRAFSYDWGTSSTNYIDINAVLNADKTGMYQVLKPFEYEIFEKSYHLIRKWRKSKINISEMKEFYSWLDKAIPKFYKDNFGLIPSKL